MNFKYFDIHSHIAEDDFRGVREEIISQMKESQIGTITIGVDFESSKQASGLASKHENIFCSIGQHPVDNKTEIFDEEKYQELLDSEQGENIKCIGECGLDYYWPKKDMEKGKISEADFAQELQRQKDLFEKQIDFSVKNNLPLMLHVRSFENGDAHEDAFEILDKKQKEHAGKVRANFHFFTETPEIAKQIIERGFYISFPGVITFSDLDETVDEVPIEKMFSETDSPYAAPVPHRGKQNNPNYVKDVVSKIAEVKKLDESEAAEQLTKNAKEFFKL